jgi:hypothetical protein
VREDISGVVSGMLYVAHTGCEWRYLPEWTPIWPKARRAAALPSHSGWWPVRSHPRRPMTPTPTQPCSHSRRARRHRPARCGHGGPRHDSTRPRAAAPRARRQGPGHRMGRSRTQFKPIAHASRVDVAHGRLGRSRRLAQSFEPTVRPSRRALMPMSGPPPQASLRLLCGLAGGVQRGADDGPGVAGFAGGSDSVANARADGALIGLAGVSARIR